MDARLRVMLALILIAPGCIVFRHRLINILRYSYASLGKGALGLALWTQTAHKAITSNHPKFTLTDYVQDGFWMMFIQSIVFGAEVVLTRVCFRTLARNIAFGGAVLI